MDDAPNFSKMADGNGLRAYAMPPQKLGKFIFTHLIIERGADRLTIYEALAVALDRYEAQHPPLPPRPPHGAPDAAGWLLE